jgi:hypothetical protein
VNNTIQIIAIAVSVGLLGLVIELVRRRLLVEEHSFVWLICAVSLLLLSLFRGALHTLARWFGIDYPPSLLLLLLFFFVFIGLLSFSVAVSRQRAEIRRLFEELAIVTARLRAVEQRGELSAKGQNDRADSPARPD